MAAIAKMIILLISICDSFQLVYTIDVASSIWLQLFIRKICYIICNLLANESSIKRMIKVKSDEEVIAGVKSGDIESFRLIIKKYNQRLYRIALSYGIDDDDCDDLIQQTYIAAYENLSQFQSKALFSTWLIKILINNCLMFKRKQKVLNKKLERISDQSNDLISHNDPEKELRSKEIYQAFEKAIKDLPEKYRTVFMLTEIEGMSLKEASQCLNISVVNTKVRAHRSKTILKELLKLQLDGNTLFTFGNIRCDRIADNVINRIKKGTN